MDDPINVPDPAWPVLRQELAASAVAVDVLPGDPERSRFCLYQLGVSARSYLGAVVLHTGGLVVDGGWLRVFGGPAPNGAARLPSIATVNRFPPAVDPAWQPAAGLVVAADVLGGVFVLNGPDPAAVGRPGAPGQLLYFAPDSLRWEAMEVGHNAWLSWLLSGGTAQFYADLRWPGWQHEAGRLGLAQGIAVYPPLWSAEAQADLPATTRRPVPMAELLGMSVDVGPQLGQPHPGFLGDC